MRRLPTLVAALLLPATPTLLLGMTAFTGELLVPLAPAQAQSAEPVAKAAQAITVRIEGATQGSGVLVKREGNRYTVLTAWHVVSDQRPGEELDIYTPDGQMHQLEQGSIKRVGMVDMSVLNFYSANSYKLANIGDVRSVRSGEQVLVAGFPVERKEKLQFGSGALVANADVGIDQGYQLLYTNKTSSGMSGGVVLTARGILIGMHGRGDLDEVKTRQSKRIIKTGINQGVPISYFIQFISGLEVVSSTTTPKSADDYLAQARALLGEAGSEQKIISLANQSLGIRKSAEAYNIRGLARADLNDTEGAIADYNLAIDINPQFAFAFNNRGWEKGQLSDTQGALLDYNRAIAIDPEYAAAWNNRGVLRFNMDDKKGAFADNAQALRIAPRYADAITNRGYYKDLSGNKQGALLDYNLALTIEPRNFFALNNRGALKSSLGDTRGAISDFTEALAIREYVLGFINRGKLLQAIGSKAAACSDYRNAERVAGKELLSQSGRKMCKSFP